MLEMNHNPVEIVRPERTAGTTFRPARTKHEVIDDELASARKQVCQRFLAVRPVEDIFLVDAFPRKVAALLTELIAQARELLFRGQELSARCQPLIVRNHIVIFNHSILLRSLLVRSTVVNHAAPQTAVGYGRVRNRACHFPYLYSPGSLGVSFQAGRARIASRYARPFGNAAKLKPAFSITFSTGP